MLKNKPKTIYLPLLLLSFNAVAESDFSVETILSGQQITQFAMGDILTEMVETKSFSSTNMAP
ncbi:hypothetical protein [Vibrio sp. AND4]|uniref:hypothetical protein n=1 Tax=Vibrio sp. AND4 TaxID=314289 RepID=UPI00015F28F4|nr:hypothetical protein [Vibrio sp. AND4]EDP57076.1 hypothetical protein AND4_08396 [Vibrio sp. AND4]